MGYQSVCIELIERRPRARSKAERLESPKTGERAGSRPQPPEAVARAAPALSPADHGSKSAQLLPGDRLFCHRRRQRFSCRLDTSVEASGPHDFSVRNRRRSSKALPRPPHPVPTFVTMANAPPPGPDGRRQEGDLPLRKTRIFLQRGLDRILVFCPSGCWIKPTEEPFSPSFRGIASGSRGCAPDDRLRDEPAIHNPDPWLWIAGLRQEAHPGMTIDIPELPYRQSPTSRSGTPRPSRRNAGTPAAHASATATRSNSDMARVCRTPSPFRRQSSSGYRRR